MIPAYLMLAKKEQAASLDQMRARYFLTLVHLAYRTSDPDALRGLFDRIERVVEARRAA